MNNHTKWLSMVMTVVITVPALAVELSGTQVNKTATGNSTTNKESLTPSELARSRAWGLSETEWHRYQALMQGIRGSISPETISPIEVLGIHARDDHERRRYAEQWARAMHEDVERILAFQHDYDAAGKRLYPNESLIDINRLPTRNEKTTALQAEDRVLFFTRPECPACDAVLMKLLKHLDQVAGIDIYIAAIKPGDDAAIRGWAVAHGIAPEWVRNRRVTLNHEGGVLARLTQAKGEIPYLLRRRGKALTMLRAAEL